MKAKALFLAVLVALPAMAANQLILTVNPGAVAATVTYYYTVVLNAYNVLSFTKSGSITAPAVPVSTTIDINVTPTLPAEISLSGTIYVTAAGPGISGTGNTTFTVELHPGDTVTDSVTLFLSNGGYIGVELIMYTAKLSIPLAALGALGAVALLRKRSKN